MPLPLPNLDTRRWADLVEEARSLIPRYAPNWTDHNYHDPGITVLELLAAKVEQDIYRVNRIPERHRRKFLALVGFPPASVIAARIVLAFRPQPPATTALVPAGTLFETANSGVLSFRTLAEVTVVEAALASVQVDDGSGLTDWTRTWQQGRSVPAFGVNAAAQARTHLVQAGQTVADIARQYEATEESIVALNRLFSPTAPLTVGHRLTVPSSMALYLGFDAALPPGQTVTLVLLFAGEHSGEDERQRLLREQAEQAESCAPPLPKIDCGPKSAPVVPPPSPLTHHSAPIVWEFYCEEGGGRWKPLDPAAGEVEDETRSFTLDGSIRVTLPAKMTSWLPGNSAAPRFYLRCRLESGAFDAAPQLRAVLVNAVAAEQSAPVWQTFPIAKGIVATGPALVAGKRTRLRFTMNADRIITAINVDPADGEVVEVMVLAYQAATAADDGQLTLALVLAGTADGQPLPDFTLPGAPVLADTVRVWTLEGDGWHSWRIVADFDASRRTDADVTLDATTGRLSFGDGERGLTPTRGAIVFAEYFTTAAEAGNVPAGACTLSDNEWNQAIVPDEVVASSPIPASGGSAAETVEHAAGRAAENLWAHERLIELCPPGSSTLDQLDHTTVLGRIAPWRANTLPDVERLALDVPGTQIARARAWAGLDPNYACLKSPGTVTLIVVPHLPPQRPEASTGLLQTVRGYLDRRRVIGTRLVVVGPQYLEVTVVARVSARGGASLTRVRDDVVAALNLFMDPLQGGPAGRGWPFGRDVYRSEILQVMDEVPGVDHVLSLELVPGVGEARCGNLCVFPTWLITPGAHSIEVV